MLYYRLRDLPVAQFSYFSPGSSLPKPRDQFLTGIEQGHRIEAPAMRTIAQRTELHAHPVAGFDGLASPAAARQHARARGFNRPLLRRAAAVRLHKDPDDDMRIGPLKRLDGTLERKRFGRFIHREGMMRQRRRCGADQKAINRMPGQDAATPCKFHFESDPTGTPL